MLSSWMATTSEFIFRAHECWMSLRQLWCCPAHKRAVPKTSSCCWKSTIQFPLLLYEPGLKRDISNAVTSGVWMCPGGTLPLAPAAWCSNPTSPTAVWQERTIVAQFSNLVREAHRQSRIWGLLWFITVTDHGKHKLVLICLPPWLCTSPTGNNRRTLFWLW